MNSIQFAWAMYLLGAAGCSLVAWWMFSWAWRFVRYSAVATVLVILLVPFAIDKETGLLAPAIFTLVFEGMSQGTAAIEHPLKLLLGIWFVIEIVIGVFVFLTRKVYLEKQQAKLIEQNDQYTLDNESSENNLSANSFNKNLSDKNQLNKDQFNKNQFNKSQANKNRSSEHSLDYEPETREALVDQDDLAHAEDYAQDFQSKNELTEKTTVAPESNQKPRTRKRPSVAGKTTNQKLSEPENMPQGKTAKTASGKSTKVNSSKEEPIRAIRDKF